MYPAARSKAHKKILCMLLIPTTQVAFALLLLLHLLLVEDLGCTLEPACAASCNETNLLSWRGIPPYSGGMPNVLVVTTTVRVLHRVHGHTTHLQSTHIVITWPCHDPDCSTTVLGCCSTVLAGDTCNAHTANSHWSYVVAE